MGYMPLSSCLPSYPRSSAFIRGWSFGIDLFSEWIRVHPRLAFFLIHRGLVFSIRGRSFFLDPSVAFPGVNAMSVMINNPLAMAADCIHSGDYSGAELACRQVLEWDPGVSEAWFVLGVANQLLGKIPESVTYYRNSVRLAPGNAEAWNNLGASLSFLRRSEEAEPCLRKALELEPGYAQAHNNLGNALQAQGRFEEALHSYHRALDLKPDYSEVFEHVGLVLQCLGRLDEAVDWFNKALELRPRWVPST